MNMSELPSLIEITASTSAVAGAYLMGSTKNKTRLASFMLFNLSNVLMMKVAMEHNMTPLLAQMSIFSYLAFQGSKNTMEEIYKEEKLEGKSSFISKLIEGKNKAIKAGLNRFDKLFTNLKDNVQIIKNTIKNNKEGTLLFSSAILLSLTSINPSINETLVNSMINLIKTPTETIAAGLALYGSYLMTFNSLSSRAKGITNFLAADILYIGIAADKNLYPLLAQSVIFLGTSAKAIYDLNKGLKESDNSYIEVIKNSLTDIKELFSPKQDIKLFNKINK